MEKGGRRMRLKMVGLFIYVCLSAAGLTLIKIGLGHKASLLLGRDGLSMQFSWALVAGMCMYVLSFLASLAVMKGMDLSLYYPLSAGLIYVAVCILGVVALKEKIVFHQFIGMAIIFAGIIVMNLGKGN